MCTISRNKFKRHYLKNKILFVDFLLHFCIPVAMCTISRNKFKRHYLKNKILFVDFLLHFWNVHAI